MGSLGALDLPFSGIQLKPSIEPILASILTKINAFQVICIQLYAFVLT